MKKLLLPLFVTLSLAQSVAMAQSVPMPMVMPMPMTPPVQVDVRPVMPPPVVFTCQALHTCPTPPVHVDPLPVPAPCTYDHDCGTVKIAPEPVAINRAR